MNPFYKFKDVKEKIELACGISYGVQRHTHDGDELNDDMTIGLEAFLGSVEIKVEILWQFLVILLPIVQGLQQDWLACHIPYSMQNVRLIFMLQLKLSHIFVLGFSRFGLV